jgi:hypothetical protein
VSSAGGTVTAGATGAAGAATAPTAGSAASGGIGDASSIGRIGSSVPGQPSMTPSVTAEGEVSRTVGQEGSSVLRGGGAGVVEGQVGGGASASAEQEAVAATRAGQKDVGNAKFAAGAAASSPDVVVSSNLGRAEHAEFSQRDQVSARAQAAEDAQSQARRAANDPAGVGTERAEMAASAKVGEAMPAEANRVQAQADVAAGAVENPRGAAQAQAEGAVATQQREAEVKVGVSGSVGTPTTDKKK